MPLPPKKTSLKKAGLKKSLAAGTMMATQAPQTPRERELSFVRALLPLYDLDFARLRMLEMDPPHALRPDVVTAIHRGIERAVEQYPEFVRHIGLANLETVSSEVVRASNAQNARDLMLAVAYRNLKMVETGWIEDAREQGVLVSMAVVAEAENDGEEWGDTTDARACADRMIRHLRFSGIYPTRSLS